MVVVLYHNEITIKGWATSAAGSPHTWITADPKLSPRMLGSPLLCRSGTLYRGPLVTLPASFRLDRNEVSMVPTVTTTNASACEG